MTELAPGGVLFRQGDRSSAFYLVESGEIEMSVVPDDAAEGDAAIPVRRYGPGESFGASGVLPGDERRRNTATALTQATLDPDPYPIPYYPTLTPTLTLPRSTPTPTLTLTLTLTPTLTPTLT